MAVDLYADAFPVLPGTKGLLFCADPATALSVAGLETWKRGALSFCRAGFETLEIVVDGDPEVVRRGLAGDGRVESRSWRIHSDAAGLFDDASGRWVVLRDRFVVSKSLLADLANTDDGVVGTATDGPFAADATTLRRWQSEGWSPGEAPRDAPTPSLPKPPVHIEVGTPADALDAREALLAATVPAGAPWFAREVQRPLSRALTRPLLETSITPNQITIASVIIGLIGAVIIGSPSWLAGVVGSLLFLFSTIVDGCDGEIARTKFGETKIGGRLDFAGDNVVHAVLFPAIALRFWAEGHPEFAWMAVSMVLGLAVTIAAIWATVLRRRALPMTQTYFESVQSREFAWALPLLAFFGVLDWFARVAAIGVWVFPLVLVALDRYERSRADR